MKRLLFRTALVHYSIFLLLAIICIPAKAQYYLTVYQTGGAQSRHIISNNDSIYFDEFKPEYVDLGLSVNWATFNVGATAPEEFGDHFAWGEIIPKSNYYWSSYKYCKVDEYDDYYFTKYSNDENNGYDGFVDNVITLYPEDDVAQVIWGGGWRMPTSDELNELINNCTWTRTRLNNIDGYKIISNIVGHENQFIFLPAAGYSDNKYFYLDYDGTYWSASLSNYDVSSSAQAYNICFNSNKYYVNEYYGDRYRGFSVRPVIKSESYDATNVTELTLDASMTYYQTNIAGDTAYSYCKQFSSDVPIRLGETFKIQAQAKNSIGEEVVADLQWISSDNNIATVNAYGEIMGVKKGACTITALYGNVQTSISVVVWEPEYVDLGLSVKWATFNLGALTPDGKGEYYAWGETQPKGASYYYEYWWDYKYGQYEYQMDKYNFDDNKMTLDIEDDAANVAWGGNWRIPTNEEFDELINNCTWTNSGNGFTVTSNVPGYEDRSIYLPFTSGYTPRGAYPYVYYYWSSSLYTDSPSYAWVLSFTQQMQNDMKYSRLSNIERHWGISIRPVCQSETYSSTNATSIVMNCPLVYIMTGKTFDLIAVAHNSFGEILGDIQWSSSDNNIAYVSESGQISAVGIGTCTVTAACGGLVATCTVNVISTPQPALTPEYVDLGLSVNWATINIGAFKPEEYGDYFAWGDTVPYYETYYAQSEMPVWKEGKEGGYRWDDYRFGNYNGRDKNTLTKYNYQDYYYDEKGNKINRLALDSYDDVAHVKWGGSWRMPTASELYELCTRCSWTWTNLNGTNGYIITSNVIGYEDRHIFLPAAGCRLWTNLQKNGSVCAYWSRSLDESLGNPGYATCLFLDYTLDEIDVARNGTNKSPRADGLTIRPVCPK